ncbi:MAG: hypothetical protein E8D47_05250 [Nitrospira sp.]|nr:MAG: hypothetical protein E8D47_05250 [Nitrospira sp.]
MAGPKKPSVIKSTALSSAATSAQTLPQSLQRLKVVAKDFKAFRRQLFAILRLPKELTQLKIQELQTLLKNAKPALEKALKANQLHPKDFGCDSIDDFIEKFAMILASRRARAKTLRGFLRSVRKGYRHNINGEVFEWLVLNLEALQKDLRQWAKYQVDLLNDIGRRTRGLSDKALKAAAVKLVDGTGADTRLNGKFGQSLRATDVWIIREDGKRVKFVDLMYVAFETVDGKPTGRISPAVMTEIKLPAAAKSGPEQLGIAVPRFLAAEKIQMTINGEVVTFDPKNVVFATASIPQTLVRAERTSYGAVRSASASYGDDTDINVRTTGKGIGAALYDILVSVEVARINAITEVVLSGGF